MMARAACGEAALTPEQRAVRPAFLASAYGPRGERALLREQPGEVPSWATGRWAIVTACNPGARQQSPQANHAAQEELRRAAQRAGLRPVPALNGPVGRPSEWPSEWDEESWLLPGATLRQARDWGGAFGQVAVVWGAGGRALLAWEGGTLERFWVCRVPQSGT